MLGNVAVCGGGLVAKASVSIMEELVCGCMCEQADEACDAWAARQVHEELEAALAGWCAASAADRRRGVYVAEDGDAWMLCVLAAQDGCMEAHAAWCAVLAGSKLVLQLQCMGVLSAA